ncbi:hypothetical protein [Methylomonas sp. TEB]|uniref:hypothetical protein n=1 Tax=Methylomonas sp. TEB TaxID=3398229 RepID=UPI0039F50DAB
MFTEINAAIQASKTALDIIKSNKELLKYNELALAVSEVNAKLLSAQDFASYLLEKNKLLSERIADMEEKMANDEKFDREFSRYKLHSLESGMLVYMIKPEHEEIGEPHYACTACASDGKISFFQPVLNGTRLVCDFCKKNVDTGWKPGAHKTPK